MRQQCATILQLFITQSLLHCFVGWHPIKNETQIVPHPHLSATMFFALWAPQEGPCCISSFQISHRQGIRKVDDIKTLEYFKDFSKGLACTLAH